MGVKYLRISFLMAALAVALGAFGAHALRPMLDSRGMEIYQTAVHYHFIHSIALTITGLLFPQYNNRWIRFAGLMFQTGLLLFCGSLYTMTFLKIGGVSEAGKLGMITPLGGLSFISGWLCLFTSVAVRR